MNKAPTVEGVRFERKPEYLAATEHLRPIRDQIIVRPAEWQPSSVIQVAGNKRKTLRGRVVAVGPGTYHWKYNRDRSKRWRSDHFSPTEVKVGDMVELGGLEIDGYDFPTVMVGTELYVIASERDVAGIVNENVG